MQHFISDLHLCPEQPETARAFQAYLHGPAADASDLWILGDLFEYWTGDDDLSSPFHTEMTSALAALAAKGTRIHVLVGNRDFLLGPLFADAARAELVSEPVVISLEGETTILMHGDSLCTDDLAYQQFRAMVRNPAWQTKFLAQPQALRHQIAADLRARSEMGKQEKAAEIMDVNQASVTATFEKYGASRMIHGHTHRPACHKLVVGDLARERWVLSDWHGRASWLQVDQSGWKAKVL
ncbi:MAG: UDP-2,3-diacylglucosamine diphosphatase [Uliginosibacterium sp.]|jgi:UDP-2,3-diacylglucosamine hydrolase|nr:UDP-2,3-diacylglucosamine diphosphatase [Uliginosibacterium sp.]MBK9616257.1 UDP-2,3-diacylglucosamine diphosphatase [Uliginosibacterium sp.]